MAAQEITHAAHSLSRFGELHVKVGYVSTLPGSTVSWGTLPPCKQAVKYFFRFSGPLHMSPVTGLARLAGRILWCVHLGNFSPVDQDEFKKHNQNGGIHELILFATARTLWALVTLLIKLFRIILKWKYIQDQNYTILAAIW